MPVHITVILQLMDKTGHMHFACHDLLAKREPVPRDLLQLDGLGSGINEPLIGQVRSVLLSTLTPAIIELDLLDGPQSAEALKKLGFMSSSALRKKHPLWSLGRHGWSATSGSDGR